MRFVGGQHLAEVLDAGSGEGADGTCRYAVDASTVRAQGAGQVTYASFQGSLGHAHDVVVRHGALGAQVRQGQQAAVAAFHHFATGFGQGHEAVGADVVRDAETVTGGGFGEVAVQLVARGEADGVHDAVQAVPLLAQLFEDLGDFFIAGHVAREAQLRARTPALCELFDTTLEFVVLISEGKLSALAMHGGSDAGCDGQLAGDTDDQYALTGEKTHVLLLFQVIAQWPEPKKRLPATAVYTDVGGRQKCFARLPVRPLGHA
ncbi:hypothetical protein D3C85_1190540 [compost metagenome]